MSKGETFSAGRLSLRNETDLARAVLCFAVEHARNPPDTMPDSTLRSILRDCMVLAFEIEQVETYIQDLNLRKEQAFETSLKNHRNRSGYYDPAKAIERFQEHYKRMVGFRRRVEILVPWRNAAYPRKYDMILATEIVDACFDAAIFCEQNYETARLERRPHAEVERTPSPSHATAG